MFFLGCFVGYLLVFPMTLRFLAGYQLSDMIKNQISLDSYMDNFLMLIFIMGIVFELPLLSWLLSKLGLLNRSFFKKYRRHAVVALLILSAVITPSGDPFTLSVVFIPLYLLYELSSFFVKAAPKEENEDVELEEDGI
ncbi:Sec-independent protein translocase protein TatC [termite gut metagenome]|uniref:Sec-independent protein translocase protein TatC n=1 Tax=termite gut metagenome TaxID=433724 RepID=A0A5J4PZ67_9ZZZZ